MDFVAIVPLRFQGVMYARGDSIPESSIPTSKIRSLLDKGLIDVVGGSGASAQRGITTYNQLAVETSADFTWELGKTFLLFSIQSTVGKVRLRLYASAAYRTADAGRAIGVDQTGDHGLIAEFIFTDELKSLWLSPVVTGALTSGNEVYGRIDNTDTGPQDITITAAYLPLEMS